MKIFRLLIFGFIVLFSCSYVFAGTFMDLKPGVSTKKDADKALGGPTKEVAPGVQYDYSTAGKDASRISISFDQGTGIIQTIDLYFKKPYPKSDLKKWFTLGEPVYTTADKEDELIEYYLPDGVFLHFSGKDDTSQVTYFGHFNPSILDSVLPKSARAYLGAYLVEHKGPGIMVFLTLKGSPADKAGLTSGDIILEIDDKRFYDSDIKMENISPQIASSPCGRPLRFLVQREAMQTELFVTLESMSEKEVSAKFTQDKEQADKLAQMAFNAMDRQSYYEAIELFKKALEHDPLQHYFYTALGSAYFLTGQNDLAMTELRKATMLNLIDYNAYRALGVVYYQTGRTDDAVATLQRAVELWKPGDDSMASFFLGASYFKQARYNEALDIFRQLNETDPQLAGGIYFLGACHDALRDPKSAVFFYKKYLESADTDADMRSNAQRRLKELTRR